MSVVDEAEQQEGSSIEVRAEHDQGRCGVSRNGRLEQIMTRARRMEAMG